MAWKFLNPYSLAAGACAAVVLGTIAWRFAFFLVPPAWTGEPARALALHPGMEIADIGAGSGALAVAMASIIIGGTGHIYSTELSPERRAAIEGRVSRASIRNVTALAAAKAGTRLPDRCCDAVPTGRAGPHKRHSVNFPCLILPIVSARRTDPRSSSRRESARRPVS